MKIRTFPLAAERTAARSADTNGGQSCRSGSVSCCVQ